MSGIPPAGALGRIARIRVLVVVLALAAVAAGAGVLAFALGDRDGTPEPRIIAQNPPPADAAELTLAEAWDAFERQLRAWGPGWRITSLASTDVNDRPEPSSGSDGRRAAWQAEAVDTATGEVRWLRLTGAALTDAAAPGLKTTSGAALPPDRPRIDSPGALEAALAARPSLGPGSDKAIGFHFSYGYDAASGRPALAVIGSVRGAPARVLVDPNDGTVLRAEVLDVSGGPILVSTDGGTHWGPAGLEGFVRAAASDPALGSEAPIYAAVWTGDALGLWRSIDGGRSWVRAAALPPSAGPVAHAVAVGVLDGAESVVVSTNSGLWAYRVASQRLEPIDSPGLVLALAVDDEGLWHAIAMRPGDPSSARHYVREPGAGSPWKESGPGFATALTAGADVRPYHQASGATVVAADGSLVRATPVGIERSEDGGASWQVVAPGSYESLTASPDGRVLYAVRYPGTVVRSADGGRTWEEAASLPTRDVALFAPAPSVVVAAGAGGFGWRPF